MAANGAERGGLTPDRPSIAWSSSIPPPATRCARRWRAIPNRAIVPTAPGKQPFRYPELRVVWQPTGPCASPAAPGRSSSRPALFDDGDAARFFRQYLLEQLRPLVAEFGARIHVSTSAQEIPYPFVTEEGDEFAHGDLSVADLARHFPTPMLANVGDEVADGTWSARGGQARPLALFDAVRVDFSLRRLVHYTGTDWRTIQPWILLTNYQRYVDQFVRLGGGELASRTAPTRSWSLPGGAVVRRGDDAGRGRRRARGRAWHRFQMPAYNLRASDDRAASPSSISASAPPTPRTSPTTSRCCARIAG